LVILWMWHASSGGPVELPLSEQRRNALADIIAFPARTLAGTSHGTPEQKHPAEILFFTGVRIERHADDVMAAEPAPERSPAKRPAPSPERSTPRRRRS
jgi:hypothetical protein